MRHSRALRKCILALFWEVFETTSVDVGIGYGASSEQSTKPAG
jgi:hypothetical protein